MGLSNFRSPKYIWLDRASRTNEDLFQLRVELGITWDNYKALSSALDAEYRKHIKSLIKPAEPSSEDMPWD